MRATWHTAILTATVAVLALTGPAGAAKAPGIDLQPEKLTRGPDIAVAHIDGDDFVHGDRRVDLPGARATLFGRVGDAWLVGTTSADGMRNRKIVRVEADDSLTVIMKGINPWVLTLSEDGRRLAAGGSGRIRVWSARTGTLQRTRRFPTYVDVVAARRHRILLTSWERGTSWWNLRTRRVTRLTTRPASVASIRRDLLATYTGDPYRDGCTLLTRLSDPGARVWRSCTDRIDVLSPDGKRMVTTDILSDGIGPNRYTLRRIGGAPIARYTTGWFSGVRWEDPETLLLRVNGEKRTATVRCVVVTCENATDPGPVIEP